jgi:hypothetical protein
MELYTALGLQSKRASLEEIKKAYKKKSLSLHPDKLKQRGIAATDETAKEFLRVKEAYEILSDKKRRSTYDQVGLTGLKLLENPSEVDPAVFISNFQKNRKDRVVLIFILLVVFALIFFLPVMFALKCDGSLNGMPWFVVWTPMWIVDAVMLISALTLFTMDTTDPAEKGDKDKDTDMLGGNTEEDEDEDETKMVVSMYEKVTNLLSTVLFVVAQVLVLAQMDHAMDISWFTVFIPWYLHEALGFVVMMQSAMADIPVPNHDDPTLIPDPEEAMDNDVNEAHFALEMKHFEALQNQFSDKKGAVASLLTIWFAMFLAMQLNTGYTESYSWGLVFLPVWLYLAMELGAAYYLRLEGGKLINGLDPESLAQENLDWRTAVKVTQAQSLQSGFPMTFVMVCVFPLLMAVLTVCKLQGSSYSTFIILLPILIVLGCLCMCVFGAFFCLANVDPDKMDEEIKAQRQGHASGGADGSYGATGTTDGATEVSSATIPVPQNYSPPPEPVVIPAPKPAPATVKTEDVSIDMID